MHFRTSRRVWLGRRVGALVLASVLTCVVAAPALAAGATPRHDTDGVLTKATVHRTSSGLRDVRAWSLVPALLTTAVAMGFVHEHGRRRLSLALVAHHRRISDVGDDWRALLLGAPPASA